MEKMPNSCIACIFDSSCNTGINMPGCRFYGTKKEAISFKSRLMNFFGKLFM